MVSVIGLIILDILHFEGFPCPAKTDIHSHTIPIIITATMVPRLCCGHEFDIKPGLVPEQRLSDFHTSHLFSSAKEFMTQKKG